jgi:hypothetical protein
VGKCSDCVIVMKYGLVCLTGYNKPSLYIKNKLNKWNNKEKEILKLYEIR